MQSIRQRGGELYMENGRTSQKKTLSAKRMIIPATIAMLLMHLLIVLNTVRINDMGSLIAEATQRSFQLSGISSGYSQMTDVMAGTALSYVNEGGEEQLGTFFETLGQIGGSYQAMQQLLHQEQPEHGLKAHLLPHAQAAEGKSASEYLQDSYSAVLERAQTEKTALAVSAQAREVELSTYPELQAIETPAELEGIPAGAKIAQAREMLLDPEYQSSRAEVQRNLSIAVSMANNATAAQIQQYSAQLANFRLIQWILMGLIIVTMVVMITLLFTRLLLPLEKSVNLVQKGELLSTEHGFSELRRLANSYDELLTHRNELENDLRERGYTDALTGLPNRMAYQEYVKNLEKLPEDTSVAVFSMDVNGLKGTNDKRGHRYGDILLRDSAACILKVFGDETGKNVFRIGGDEFAAFWLNCTQEQARSALEVFREEQTRYAISISVGYAWAPNVRDEKIQAMAEQADRQMYGDKAARKKTEK